MAIILLLGDPNIVRKIKRQLSNLRAN